MVKDRIVVWETLESLKKKLEAEDDDEPPTLRHLLKDATLVIQLYGDDRGTFYSHRIETDDFATKLVVEFDNLLKWSAVGQENIRHCSNETCKTPFIPLRKPRKGSPAYCSNRCARIVAARNYRANKKAKKKKAAKKKKR